MTSRFVRVSWGLEYTDVFLHIDTIKAYMRSFQQDRDVDQSTKMGEEIALSAQDRMEEEINQTIRTCDKLTKAELFEYLASWILYFEYHLNNTQNIEKYINEYNEKRLIEYNKLVEIEEDKFKQTKEYQTLNHLDFHKVDYTETWGLIQRAAAAAKRLEQYRKFFEAPDPDLIDIASLPKYIDIIRPIISRCVNIARKRLSYLKVEKELKTKANKVTTPIIGLFCFLVNESGLIPKGEDENTENYCKKICKQYNLPYSDRVRQNFSVSDNKRNRQKVKDVILPNIDKKTSKSIIELLNNKDQTNQKLYG